jgi:hypothetical protein
MTITYAEKWLTADKKPFNPMDAAAARKRHEARKPYTALIGGEGRPSCTVEVSRDWVSVRFLDDHLRQYLQYDFKVVDPNRLFLKGAIHMEFDGNTGNTTLKKIFNFHDDGSLDIEEIDRKTGQRREFAMSTDVSQNWDDYPAFGDYVRLCRKERGAATDATSHRASEGPGRVT